LTHVVRAQEERLIAQLQRVEGEAAAGVCARAARALLGGGPASCLGTRVHPRSAPAHTFARYLFLALLPADPELAYRVGLRAMRYLYRAYFINLYNYIVICSPFFVYRSCARIATYLKIVCKRKKTLMVET
jgi:hypothetical protein